MSLEKALPHKSPPPLLLLLLLQRLSRPAGQTRLQKNQQSVFETRIGHLFFYTRTKKHGSRKVPEDLADPRVSPVDPVPP